MTRFTSRLQNVPRSAGPSDSASPLVRSLLVRCLISFNPLMRVWISVPSPGRPEQHRPPVIDLTVDSATDRHTGTKPSASRESKGGIFPTELLDPSITSNPKAVIKAAHSYSDRLEYLSMRRTAAGAEAVAKRRRPKRKMDANMARLPPSIFVSVQKICSVKQRSKHWVPNPTKRHLYKARAKAEKAAKARIQEQKVEVSLRGRRLKRTPRMLNGDTGRYLVKTLLLQF
jgi:hypothetical protein